MFYKVKTKRSIVLTDMHTPSIKLNWCVFMATLGNAHLELNVLKFTL